MAMASLGRTGSPNHRFRDLASNGPGVAIQNAPCSSNQTLREFDLIRTSAQHLVLQFPLQLPEIGGLGFCQELLYVQNAQSFLEYLGVSKSKSVESLTNVMAQLAERYCSIRAIKGRRESASRNLFRCPLNAAPVLFPGPSSSAAHKLCSHFEQAACSRRWDNRHFDPPASWRLRS